MDLITRRSHVIAFPGGSQSSRDKRLSRLFPILEIYGSRWNELACDITTEMGTPLSVATVAQVWVVV